MIHPVFSPTQTERFIRCPRLWDLSRRWERPEDDHWLQKLIGTSLHAGIASHYRKDGEDPYQAALNTLKDSWPEVYGDDLLPGASEIVKKTLRRTISLGLGEGAEILEIEAPLGTEDSRVDLVYRDISGITVVDWKYIHHGTAWTINKRAEEAQVSWQLRHYAWRVQEKYPSSPVTSIGLVLMVGGPSVTIKWAPVSITPMMLGDWFESAVNVWSDIQACREGYKTPRAHFGEACLRYGGCPFFEACHTCHGDEEKFGQLYKRKDPK